MKKHRFLKALLWFIVISLALGSILAAFDTYYWVFELFAHFVMQYILLSVLLLPVTLWIKRWRLALILLLVLGINSHEVWGIYRDFSQPREECEAGKTITILQSNVFYRNWNIDGAAKQLRKVAAEADIVVFNEFDKEWRIREGEGFSALFPYHYTTWIKGNIEKIAIFSREPFEVQQYSGRVPRNAHLRLLFPTYGLTLITYHGFSPINERWTVERNYELLRIARDMERMHSPALMMGDFNQTPYATAMQQAMREGKLHMAHFPHGLMPTWPNAGLTFPLEIPIDHLLANEHVRICKRKVIEVPGSDHGAVRTIIQPLTGIPDFRNVK